MNNMIVEIHNGEEQGTRVLFLIFHLDWLSYLFLATYADRYLSMWKYENERIGTTFTGAKIKYWMSLQSW